MGSVNEFVNDSLNLLQRLKVLKDEVIEKTKIFEENKISIEILEKNLGLEDKIIKYLKKTNQDLTHLANVQELKIIEEKVKHINEECLSSMSLLLDLHYKINLEMNEVGIDSDDALTDPIGVEIAKLLWGDKVDNLQLRADPPISGVHKDDRRQPLNDNDDTFCPN
jgi:hypothetical protein